MINIETSYIKIVKKYFIHQNNFNNLIVLIFFILSFIGILNHEMWRDELQAWMIAKDSVSLIDLFQNLRYEGHPGLWHICLFLISRVTHNPTAMQIFHLFISTSSIYIFVKYSPFTNLQKSLFCFGYLPFYHYNLISRNYSCGILLIFIFCSLFKIRHQSYILLAIILAIIANTNSFAFILAVCLGMTLLVDRFISNQKYYYPKRLDLLVSIIIFLAGILIALIQMIPPSDAIFTGNAALQANNKIPFLDIQRFILTLNTISNAYFPITQIIKDRFFKIDIAIISTIRDIIILSVSLFALYFSVNIFIKQKVVLFLYLSGTLTILLFSYFKFLGSMRHYGHLFILLFICLWLLNDYEIVNKQVKINNAGSILNRYQEKYIILILLIHFLFGFYFFYKDLTLPFSESKNVANYIQKHHLNEMVIAGSKSAQISPIAGLLDKKIYYPESDSFESFINWNKRKNVKTPEVIEKISKLLDKNNHQLLLILNYQLDLETPELRISKISQFTNSMTIDEIYYLYLVNKKK
jgi:hypothetical protein